MTFVVKLAGEASQPGGLGLVLHQRGILSGIEIGILFLKGAGNAFIPDDPAVIPDGGGIGLRILPGLIFAVLFQQCTVNIAVLGGDFGGGILCLPAAVRPASRTTTRRPASWRNQAVSRPGDAGADDRDVSAFLPGQPLTRRKSAGFCPERFHKKHPIIPFFGLTVPGIPVPYTPRKQRDNEKCKQGMTAPPIYAIL